MKTEKEIQEKIKSIIPEQSDWGLYALAQNQYRRALQWVLEDEEGYKKSGTVEDSVTKETIDKWLESFKALSESPDMERIMKEAYQREKLDQRLKGRKPIKDNPDADIIPGQSNEDYQDSINAKEKYPEGTDEEWVRNAKASCESTLRGAEEAMKILKNQDILKVAISICEEQKLNESETAMFVAGFQEACKYLNMQDDMGKEIIPDHITVYGEDNVKYIFPNPEKMKVNWLPERVFEDKWEDSLPDAKVDIVERQVECVEWHDASKKLPDNNRNVLVYYKCESVNVQTMAWYSDYYKRWTEWCGDTIPVVIAWTELLEAPKFEEK